MTTTRRGRVVYNRKKHDFTLRDLLRIGWKLGAEPIKVFGRNLVDPFGIIRKFLEEHPDLRIVPTFWKDISKDALETGSARAVEYENQEIDQVIILITYK